MKRVLLGVFMVLAACERGAAEDEKAPPARPVNPLSPEAQSTPPVNPLAGGGSQPATPTQAPANPLGASHETAPVAGQDSGAGQAGPPTPIVIGQVYRGPARLAAPSVGLHFDVPEGWQAQAPGTIPLMVVSNGASPDVLTLLWAQRPADLSTVKTLLSEPLDLGPNAALRFGPVQVSGTSVSATVQATNGSTGRIEGMVDRGASVLVLTVGPAGQSAAGDAMCRTLLQSMRFVAHTPGELASRVPNLRTMLAGTRLERISSEQFDGGFISSQSMWDFCSDGSFRYAESSTTSVSGVTSADTGSSTDELGSFSSGGTSDGNRLQGRWQLDAVGSIAGAYLQMTMQDAGTGRVQYMPIAPTQSGVDFEGLSWSAVTSPLCQ